MKNKSCICLPNDPSDYHLATCIICFPKCKGHPINYKWTIEIEREIITGALEMIKTNSKLRYGQAVSNYLEDNYPNLYEVVKSQGLDPFYNDKLVHKMISFLWQQAY